MNFFNRLLGNSIARRYFVMNSFDGLLTTSGIILALFFSGVIDFRVLISSCIGYGVAVIVSGFSGAYISERAERRLKIRQLEKHLLTNLKHSNLYNLSKEDSVIVAFVNGFSPFITMLLLVLPFFFISGVSAYYVSFIIAGVVISLLGVFIARIANERVLFSIFKMFIIGGLVFF